MQARYQRQCRNVSGFDPLQRALVFVGVARALSSARSMACHIARWSWGWGDVSAKGMSLPIHALPEALGERPEIIAHDDRGAGMSTKGVCAGLATQSDLLAMVFAGAMGGGTLEVVVVRCRSGERPRAG